MLDRTSVCVSWLRLPLLALPNKYPAKAAVTMSSNRDSDIDRKCGQFSNICGPLLLIRVYTNA